MKAVSPYQELSKEEFSKNFFLRKKHFMCYVKLTSDYGQTSLDVFGCISLMMMMMMIRYNDNINS